MKEQDFIQKICGYAISDMKENGILASVTIAQAILESSWGTSELAKKANNYFGMKCSLSSNSWGSVWDRVSKYTKVTNEQDEAGKIYTIKADFRAYPDIEMSIKDHSMYLVGAMNGTEHRYCGIANEKDYRKAVEIIKAGGYATDINYVSKICSIIKKYELTQYDEMEELNMGIEIRKQIATNSPCNKTGDEITVKGSMLHSVGCPQPKPEVFAKIWETSTGACVHAVTGADAYAIQCLPLFPERKKARRGWHGASGKNGSVNNTHLSLEMTEPATIKYVGGATWIETGDGSNTKRHVLATYANAVQVFAKWCKEFGLNPLEDGVIISHHEGNQRGIAKALGREITDIDAATVHKFQGKEMECIIISTVDDEISDFTDDPYLINVAVSRAKKKLMLVVTGNKQSKERNITDLIDYIEYNNFEVVESKIYSVFDYLYKQYTEARKAYLQKHKKISAYDSENLMYSLIEDILSDSKYSSLDVVCHFPLNMLIKNPEFLSEEECRYAMNPATHLDFLIYNRISKKPVLAIEVDGYEYHKKHTVQASRDLLKNRIMESYEIPLLRFMTNCSGEKEKIIEMLDKRMEQ